MTFPNPNFDHEGLNFRVKNIIDSHGMPLSAIVDKETRELREATDGGIEIKKHEIPYVQRMFIERVNNLDRQIESLQSAIDTYTVANLENARVELEGLKRDQDFLKNNLVRKFFPEANPEDTETTE